MFHSPACRHRSAQPPPRRAPYFDRNLAEAFFAFPLLSHVFRLSLFSAFPFFPPFPLFRGFLKNKSLCHRCLCGGESEKCALLKMARSKTSRKLYLRVDKANKLKKISMNSTIKTKKENNLENFYRQR